MRAMHLFWLDILCFCYVTLVLTVTDDRHTLSSRLVHEGDASFLVGHLLFTCLTLLRHFL